MFANVCYLGYVVGLLPMSKCVFKSSNSIFKSEISINISINISNFSNHQNMVLHVKKVIDIPR